MLAHLRRIALFFVMAATPALPQTADEDQTLAYLDIFYGSCLNFVATPEIILEGASALNWTPAPQAFVDTFAAPNPDMRLQGWIAVPPTDIPFPFIALLGVAPDAWACGNYFNDADSRVFEENFRIETKATSVDEWNPSFDTIATSFTIAELPNKYVVIQRHRRHMLPGLTAFVISER